MKHELHPLCVLFPRLTGGEFDALRDDIAANGLRQPIVLHDGMILDGGNRYLACLEAHVEPKFVQFDGDNLVTFVLSANLHRRHMTPGQQAAIVASAQDWAKAQSRGGDRKSDQSATLHFDRVEERAAQSGASIRTQKMADKVARKDPALAQKVAHGEVSLPAAARKVEGKPKPATTNREQTKVIKLEARIAELEEENERLRTFLAGAEDATQQAVETAANLQAVADGEDAKRLEILTAKLRVAETRRNELMNENAALKRQIKAMQRAEKRAA